MLLTNTCPVVAFLSRQSTTEILWAHILSLTEVLIFGAYEPHVCNVMVACWIEDVYRVHLGGVSPEAIETASNASLEMSTIQWEVRVWSGR